jgi:hypothetical protein
MYNATAKIVPRLYQCLVYVRAVMRESNVKRPAVGARGRWEKSEGPRGYEGAED